MKGRLAVLAFIAAGVAACGGGGGGGYSSPTGTGNGNGSVPANTVEATDALVFTPATLTVAKGTSVTFTFGATAHTVNFTGTGAPANIDLSSSTSVQRTFSSSGTFNFNCTVHNYMTGVVTVQ